MKRFLSATLVASMVLSSCGSNEPAKTEGEATPSTETTTETTDSASSLLLLTAISFTKVDLAQS